MNTSINKVIFTLLLTAHTISGAITITQYDQLRMGGAKPEERAYLNIRIGGVAEGYDWANSFLVTGGRAELYCSPDNIAFNTDNYLQFLDEELNANRASYARTATPIEYILLRALQSKFPCTP